MRQTALVIKRVETSLSVRGLVAFPEALYFFKKLHYGKN